MQTATSFDELQTLTASKFEQINLDLESLSYNFSNIPLSGYVKNKIADKYLKQKAGWYACLVNRNIDVLLLPDYFDHNQTRNILIKKETEAFYEVFERFKEFKNIESNTELYESFFKTIEQVNNSFDLFSSQIVKKESCPAAINALFETWQPITDNYLQTVILQFYEWHTADNFSFSSKRQIIVWLNYKLWKKYGLVFKLIDFEYFLFNNWNKENRSGIQSVLDIADFIQSKIEALNSELKLLYREEIGYDKLLPFQKIANNYLFNQNFKIKLNTTINEASLVLADIISKKGFITYNDLPLKMSIQNVEDTLRQWEIEKVVRIEMRDNIWYVYLRSETSILRRLNKFNNIDFDATFKDWKLFSEYKFIPQIKKEETIVTHEVPTFELKQEMTTRKAKAFFG